VRYLYETVLRIQMVLLGIAICYDPKLVTELVENSDEIHTNTPKDTDREMGRGRHEREAEIPCTMIKLEGGGGQKCYFIFSFVWQGALLFNQ